MDELTLWRVLYWLLFAVTLMALQTCRRWRRMYSRLAAERDDWRRASDHAQETIAVLSYQLNESHAATSAARAVAAAWKAKAERLESTFGAVPGEEDS